MGQIDVADVMRTRLFFFFMGMIVKIIASFQVLNIILIEYEEKYCYWCMCKSVQVKAVVLMWHEKTEKTERKREKKLNLYVDIYVAG